MERLSKNFHSPSDSFRIKRLAHAAHVPDIFKIVLFNQSVSGCHEHPYGSGRSVPNADIVLVEYRIPFFRVEPAVVCDRGRAVRPASYYSIGHSCNPSRIGGAPVHIVFPQIQHPLCRHVFVNNSHVRVNHSLRAAGCSGSVEHESVVRRLCPCDLENIGSG